MSLSDNYPDTRPVWMNDYANAGVIDPRCSFSRSDSTPSNVHYWSDEDHVSSENLLLQSSDFDTTWTKQGLATPIGGQADPAGGTDGFTLVEDSGTSNHRVYQTVDATGDLAFVVYAKQNSGTRYLNLTIGSSAGGSLGGGLATFDLAGGTPHTSNGSSSTLTNLSATQTASGGGYYKCVFKATAAADISAVHIGLSNTAAPVAINYGLVSYTGDGSSSINVAFASLSTTGSTDYNATTTQIHREYAATLKSVAYSGQPRFEYEPTGDRSAKGLLIEGQSQNLNAQSDDISNWNGNTGSGLSKQSNFAIAPNGQLIADKLTPNDGATGSAYATVYFSATSGEQYTHSFYAKADGQRYITLYGRTTSGVFDGEVIHFDLQNGTVDIAVGTDVTASIEPVGGGWHLCVATLTADVTATGYNRVYVTNGAGLSVTGDGYSGVLFAHSQIEQSSFQSSYISTSGSASTRTADQLSADTADIGYTGGPVTLFAESSTQTPSYNSNNRGVVDLSEPASSNNRVMIYNRGAQAGGFFVNADNVQQGSGFGGITDDSYTKVGVSVDTNSIKHCVNGVTVTTDTSAVIPDRLTKMFIGQTRSGSGFGGHIKRIYLYPEALTDTELQSLTS